MIDDFRLTIDDLKNHLRQHLFSQSLIVNWRRITVNRLKTAAAIGLAGIVAAFLLSGRERFWANWILWFLFLLTIGLGSLFIVALEHVVGATWSKPLRRVPERLSSLALLMGPAALIALLSLRFLYP